MRNNPAPQNSHANYLHGLVDEDEAEHCASATESQQNEDDGDALTLDHHATYEFNHSSSNDDVTDQDLFMMDPQHLR